MRPRPDHTGVQDGSLNRRRLLQIGGLGSLGLNLSGVLRAEAAAAPGSVGAPRTIRSCILLFYYGGPSHLDTWDMKPKAPREVRGIFDSIATNVPGIRVSEHQPHCTRIVDRLAIVRSMHHPMTNHNAAAFATLSGRPPLKGDLETLGNDRNDPPCLGSTISAVLPKTQGMPPFVALPYVMHNVVTLPGQVAGFLGSTYNPLQISRDPNAADFSVDELVLPGDVSLDRLGHRESLLHLIDGQLRRAELRARADAAALDTYNAKAFDLLRSAAVRRAFDIAQEDPKLRDRYGRTMHGQGVLLARRLVEAGVRIVTVYDGQYNGQTANWDAHENVFGRLKNDLLPPADRALAALIEDLTERRLLDSTLVIIMGEFGRTPRINKNVGRDHWPFCYTAMFAGGGVQGGITYGTSDKIGAYPETDGVTPGDLAATLFWRFGVDSEAEIRDLTGRPYRLADGQPLRKLFPGAA